MVCAPHCPTLAVGHGYPPFEQVVDACAPAHGELAARVFCNVATNSAGPGTGGVSGEHQAVFAGVFHGSFRDDASFHLHHLGCDRASIRKLQVLLADAANVIELFGIHHNTAGSQRHRPTGQAGAGSTRNGLEAEACNGRQKRSYVCFHVWRHHGEREIQAPIRSIGGMRDQRERIEEDVAAADNGAKFALDAVAQIWGAFHVAAKLGNQLTASGERVEYACIAVCPGADGFQVPGDIFKKPLPPGSGIDQFLEEIGIAAVNQHVAKNAHEMTGGAARDSGAAKLVQNTHRFGAKQECNGLMVVGGCVVERDFARTASRQFAYARKGQHV